MRAILAKMLQKKKTCPQSFTHTLAEYFSAVTFYNFITELNYFTLGNFRELMDLKI